MKYTIYSDGLTPLCVQYKRFWKDNNLFIHASSGYWKQTRLLRAIEFRLARHLSYRLAHTQSLPKCVPIVCFSDVSAVLICFLSWPHNCHFSPLFLSTMTTWNLLDCFKSGFYFTFRDFMCLSVCLYVRPFWVICLWRSHFFRVKTLQVAEDYVEATPNLRVGTGHLLLWHYRQVVGIAKIWKRTEVRLDLAGRRGEYRAGIWLGIPGLRMVGRIHSPTYQVLVYDRTKSDSPPTMIGVVIELSALVMIDKCIPNPDRIPWLFFERS